jgi:hypothetical protein
VASHSRLRLGPLWWLSEMTYTGSPLACLAAMQDRTPACWLAGRLATSAPLLSGPVVPGLRSAVRPVHITTWLTRTGGVLPLRPVTRGQDTGASQSCGV